MISLEGTIIYFLLGCLAGLIAARAAIRFREGMGIGFVEPFIRIFSPAETSPNQTPKTPTAQKIKNILRSDVLSPESLAIILLGGALFVFIGHGLDPNFRTWNLTFAALLLIISAVDQKQSFIPDTIVFILISVGFLRAILTDASLQDAAIGFVAAHAMASIVQSFFDVFKREGFYWGDLKFALALGVWVGFPGISWILFIASFLGLIYGLTTRQRIFPFAPFLSIAALLVLTLGDQLNLIISWG